MSDRRSIKFNDSMPMQRGIGCRRYLNTQDPERWIFKCKITLQTFILFLAVAPIFFVALLPGKEKWIFWCVIGIIGLVILAVFLKNMICSPVFDFANNCFCRENRKPKYGDMTTLKDYLPLSQISGVQFLYKICYGRKGRTYQAYEINLFTQELVRIFVVDGTDKKQLLKEAGMLAEKLSVPLKINDNAEVQAKNMPLWLSWLLALLFSLSGIGFFWSCVYAPYTQQKATQQWIATPAVVLQSSIQSRRRSSKSGSSRVYWADIKYQYQYKGRLYDSDRSSFFSDESSRRSYAERAVKQYAPGKRITCYVNPAKPFRAVLTTKINYMEVTQNCFVSLFMFVVAGVFFFTRKRTGK